METRRHVHEEVFPTTPQRLCALLHTPSAIRDWWGAAARVVVLAEPGGTWTAAWGEAESDPDHITTATIRDFDPPRRMSLSDFRNYARDGALPFEADLEAEFLVSRRSEGASPRVVQEGFPTAPEADEDYAACATGWRETFEGVRRHLATED